MKVALRTSGGRGEYELAGRQGDKHSTDFVGKEMLFELTPDIVVPGLSTTTLQGNKPRIRLIKNRGAKHFYRLASSFLLLPDPIRELGKTGGGSNLLRDARFSIAALQVDVADHDSASVTLRPTAVLIKNAADESMRIGFAERMGQVMALWRHSAEGNDPLSRLIQGHARVVTEPPEDHARILAARKAIKDFLGTDGDLLEAVLAALDLRQDIGADLPEDEGEDIDADIEEDEDISQIQAKRRQVRHWRRQASRGNDGRKFRKMIIDAYDSRCLISGLRLPKTTITLSAGVDAAHILPWSRYDLCSVRNGICVSKLCHWAFDSGILKIEHDRATRTYSVVVPKSVQDTAAAEGLDIGHFLRMQGNIPSDRLPDDEACWPNPSYLALVNSVVFDL